jgi:hypothetical protein
VQVGHRVGDLQGVRLRRLACTAWPGPRGRHRAASGTHAQLHSAAYCLQEPHPGARSGVPISISISVRTTSHHTSHHLSEQPRRLGLAVVLHLVDVLEKLIRGWSGRLGMQASASKSMLGSRQIERAQRTPGQPAVQCGPLCAHLAACQVLERHHL